MKNSELEDKRKRIIQLSKANVRLAVALTFTRLALRHALRPKPKSLLFKLVCLGCLGAAVTGVGLYCFVKYNEVW